MTEADTDWRGVQRHVVERRENSRALDVIEQRRAGIQIGNQDVEQMMVGTAVRWNDRQREEAAIRERLQPGAVALVYVPAQARNLRQMLELRVQEGSENL